MNTGQTGPRTEAGKARSARNALKHGFTAAHLVVAEDERELFESFHEALRAEIRPKGCFEETLFSRLVHASWNLHRIKRTEANLFAQTDPFLDPALGQALDRLIRYQRLQDRARSSALKDLREQQTRRMTLERIYSAIQIGPDEILPITADAAKIRRAVAQANGHSVKAANQAVPQNAATEQEGEPFGARFEPAAAPGAQRPPSSMPPRASHPIAS